MSASATPVKVFISYKKHDDPAAKDESGRRYVEELAAAISSEKRGGGV